MEEGEWKGREGEGWDGRKGREGKEGGKEGEAAEHGVSRAEVTVHAPLRPILRLPNKLDRTPLF